MSKTIHTQENINSVWREYWKTISGVSFDTILNSRLFVEAFPVIEKYIPEKFDILLDAGGGTGWYGLTLAQKFPKSSIVISDILEESLLVSKDLAEQAGISNVRFQREDILASSFPDNYFDVVLSDTVIQHLPDYRKAIRELRRITKPGGRVIISTVNFWNFHALYKLSLEIIGKKYQYGYEKLFSKKELARTMKKEGLRIIATDGFYVGYGIFRLKKYHKIFHFLGRAVNRLAKILDKFTNRFFTRNFGFEVLVIGEKPIIKEDLN